MMRTQEALVMFGVFVGISLVVTYWASGQSTTSRGFYAAHRRVSGAQNGWAIAGDYMSAASFLGITGLTAFYGFDGFFYGVGAFVGFLVVLMLVAEPLRNTGKYTMADLITFRLRGRSVRAMAAISTLAVSLFYMIAQMVGGGAVVHLLLPQLSDSAAIVIVAVLMITYVLFGGMLATTWVQIIKAGLLMSAAVALSILVLVHYHFSIGALFQSASAVSVGGKSVNLLGPGLLFAGSVGAWNLVSFALSQALGTAGLPHVLIRFFTVSSASAARRSVAWAMVLIGVFYLLVSLMGLGAAAIVGDDLIGTRLYAGQAISYIAHHASQAASLNAMLTQYGYIVPKIDSNLAVPLLAAHLGGSLLTAFVSAVAFATILAVVAGLTIAASSAFAHDIWFNLVRNGKAEEKENLWVARATAIVVGVLSIVLSISLRGYNVAFLVGLIFAVAASANVPVILLSLAWKRFSSAGAIAGMVGGLFASILLIAISPVGMGDHALFPIPNPGIVSIPFGFLAAMVASLLVPDREAQDMYGQLQVRAATGLGAEI